MSKIISIPMAIIMLLFSWIIPAEKPDIDKDDWNTNYKYVWVHGLMGWGSYDFYYDLFPYWGVLNGDLMKKLNKDGYEIDEKWLENDGLVNTFSALAPSSAPSATFDESDVKMGIWNIMPVYKGDHMSLQGGFSKVNSDVYGYYVNYLDMINRL